MYDELTQVDIKKMQEELDYRILTLRPKLIADVQFARSYGDLSENFEYKEAKRQRGRNESRIRYLQRMIKTARVVDPTNTGPGVGLFDTVTLYLPEDEEEMVVQLVTTLRTKADQGRISRESPLGRAIFGKKVGEQARVTVNDAVSYPVVIRAIEKGQDDESMEIAKY